MSKATEAADADLVSPLIARVDFQPLERLRAGAEIERGGDGGLEIFRLRRVGRLAFVADRLYSARSESHGVAAYWIPTEGEGFRSPLRGVAEQLDLESFHLRGKGLFAEAAIAEAEREVEGKICLLATIAWEA